MEALLNKLYNQTTTEEEEDLEKKIQAELDAYDPENNQENLLDQTSQSLSFLERSFLGKDENNLVVWKEINAFRSDNEKLFNKFQKNIQNLNEITEKFHIKKDLNEEKLNENNEEVNLAQQKDINSNFNTNIIEKNKENFGLEIENKKSNGNADFIKNKEKDFDFDEKIDENFQNEDSFLANENIENINNFLNFFPNNKAKEKLDFLNINKEEVNRIDQEFEWFRMEKEDLLSKKIEEENIKKVFSLISYQLPLKICQSTLTPSFLPHNFSHRINLFQANCKIDLPKPLIPSEHSLLPKNSKEICLLEIKKLKNPYKQLFSPSYKKTQILLDNIEKKDIPEKVTEVSMEFTKKIEGYTNQYSITLLKAHKIMTNIFKELKLENLIGLIQNFREKIPPFISLQHFVPVVIDKPKDDETKSFLNILSAIPNSQNLKAIECKYEGIRSLKGIEKLENALSLRFSINKITDLQTIFPTKLISIDLSQNNIVDYSPLTPLANLRFLSLEMNNIIKMHPLKTTVLEYLNLNKNHIERIENLENKPNLTKLLLYQNQINDLEGIVNKGLVSLEYLDLGRNKISILNGLNSLPGVRKLILYNNEIIGSKEKNISLLFLNELYLNNNRLETVDFLRFLPSLEILNLENNNLHSSFDKQKLFFAPNLRVLKLAYNRFASFLAIFGMIAGKNVNFYQISSINYEENPFLQNISIETESFFEKCILSQCPKITTINEKSVENQNLCMKKISILENAEIFKYLWLFSIQNQEYRLISQLENEKIKNSFFKTSMSFINKRKFLQVQHLSYLKSPIFNKNIDFFIEKEKFENKVSYSLHKILGLILKKRYQKKKFREKLNKNIGKIIKIQSVLRAYLVKKKLHRKKNDNEKKQLATIKIQKIFRGYLLRKRKKALFQDISYKDPEIDELKEISMDFLGNKITMDDEFSLKLPEFISNYEENTLLSNKKKLPPLKKIDKIEVKSEKILENQEKNFQNNNKITGHGISSEKSIQNNDLYLESLSNSSYRSNRIIKGSQHALPKIVHKKEQEKAVKIMEAWGLNKPEIKETLAFKLEKERKRKESNVKKIMTAEERYGKFLKNIKK